MAGIGGGRGFAGGALLGRYGESGEPFLIGEDYKGRAFREGKLFLQIAPSPFGTASTGAYKVKIAANSTP